MKCNFILRLPLLSYVYPIKRVACPRFSRAFRLLPAIMLQFVLHQSRWAQRRQASCVHRVAIPLEIDGVIRCVSPPMEETPVFVAGLA